MLGDISAKLKNSGSKGAMSFLLDEKNYAKNIKYMAAHYLDTPAGYSLNCCYAGKIQFVDYEVQAMGLVA